MTFKKLKNTRPDALLAMGCYSCLSPVAAARLLRVPIILHEANAVPGKAVEFLARYAALTAVSFADTSRWLRGSAVKVTGLPVRADLAECPRFDDIPADAFTVFVTGGSQGARRINELASQALCLLARAGAGNLYVIHQTGTADEEAVRTAYAAAGVQARVSAFIDEMGRAYASADLVVCRAGASTCFELCLLNKPALLIPLPGALRDHQRLNALPLARAGGVDMAEQEGLSARSLMRYIKNRMESPVTLQRMSQALCELATPDAARRLADAVVACADGK